MVSTRQVAGVALTVAGTGLLAFFYPPDASDIEAAPELWGMLAFFTIGQAIGLAVASTFGSVSTIWVNRAVHPQLYAYLAGAGGTGYAVYMVASLNPLLAAWVGLLPIYVAGASLASFLLLALAGLVFPGRRRVEPSPILPRLGRV